MLAYVRTDRTALRLYESVLDTMSGGDHGMRVSSFYCSVRRLCLYVEDIGVFSQRPDGDCVLLHYVFKKMEYLYRGRMVIMFYLHYIVKKTEHYYRGRMVILFYLHYIVKKTEHYYRGRKVIMFYLHYIVKKTEHSYGGRKAIMFYLHYMSEKLEHFSNGAFDLHEVCEKLGARGSAVG